MDVRARTVSLRRCDDYSKDKVAKAVREAIDALGGIDRFVKPGMRVLVKPNLLQAAHPDKCVSTHPEVVSAISTLLKEHGCKVIIADSPGAGGIYTGSVLSKTYSTCGMDIAAADSGAELNYDTSYRELPAPNGVKVKRFLVISPALDADAIVVVSKAKTHALTTMTGAAKNMFGVIPGLEKTGFHLRMMAVDDFSDMVLDLNEVMKPRLQIMDAVIAMEGDGPHAGDPKHMGVILASDDYTAMDVAVSRLMSFDPSNIGTIKAAVRRGMIKEDLSAISYVGEDIEGLIVKDFKAPVTRDPELGLVGESRLIRTVLKLVRSYSFRPKIVKQTCIGCGKCERACPPKAIRMVKGKAKVRYKDCIRCYCCHEMCSERAILLERSRAGKIMARMVERKGKKQV